MYDLQTGDSLLLALAAFLVGFSKTGVAGIGGFTVAIFANILPPRESTGALLPLLVCADLVAVMAYRQHAVWSHLWRLFPSAAVGIIGGYFAMVYINDKQVSWLIGGTLIVMVVIHFFRKMKSESKPEESSHMAQPLVITTGILAGFTTMIANAAGPIIVLYMLWMKLPKMQFLGTGAWYFLILNTFKLPFSYHLGLINVKSLSFDLILVPLVLLGGLGGRALIPYINQKWFEILALTSTLVAAARLLF
jgi:uncharacterized membrane protein YfcA